MHNTNWKVSLS